MDKLHAALSRNGTPNIGVLDGGQATHLESFGCDISSPLWSASLLASPDAAHHAAIKRLHRDFLDAGAQIIGTLTYQLCDQAGRMAGWTEDEVARVPGLFERAIRLAGEARNEHGGDGIVALSLGPYAAALANGAEYTGNYAQPSSSSSSSSTSPSPSQPSTRQLANFHKHRLAQALSAPSFSTTIDLIAFETVPRLDEAEAICIALQELADDGAKTTATAAAAAASLPPAYISFVFPPDAHGRLPWPPAAESDSDADTTSPEAVLRLVHSTVRAQKQMNGARHWPIAGLGVNCTKPHLIPSVVAKLTSAYAEAGPASGADDDDGEGLHLFIYPDGGLTWDAANRIWLPATSTSTSTSTTTSACSTPTHWATTLLDVAREALRAPATTTRPLWRGVWLGGCCMSGPAEVRELARLIGAGQGGAGA